MPSSQQTMTNDSEASGTISRLEKQEAHPYTSIKSYDILQKNNGNMSHPMSQTFNICKEEEQIPQLQGEENRPQHKFQDESNNTSSKKEMLVEKSRNVKRLSSAVELSILISMLKEPVLFTGIVII
jgi:hypothetical protein